MSVRRGKASDLCISDADVLTPLHSNKTTPASATHSKNRVRVRKTHIALVGGSCAFADFHVTPPLGRSMATIPPWPQHHQRKDCYQFDRRRRARRRELSSEGMGELNRKLWSLGELIEDVENAQGGSYSAALFWEPSQTSEAVEERLFSKPGQLPARIPLSHKIHKLYFLVFSYSNLHLSDRYTKKSESCASDHWYLVLRVEPTSKKGSVT
jgi:hypothetical protein